MKRLLALLSLIALAISFAGCQLGGGDSAPPPSDVKLTAGDGSLIVTWTMQPGVDYWVFSAAGADITPQSCSSMPGCKTAMSATSPLIITGLTNGTSYSVTIDGRTDGGPGGPGSLPASATPMPAGGTWNSGVALGPQDLRGIAYGTLHVAVGSGGAIYSSPDGIDWSSVSSGVSSNLNAVAYGTAGYVAAGSGGVLLHSSDAATWTADISPTGNELSALIANGNVYVAAGMAGTLIYSTDGVNWVQSNSGTTNDLYGLAYGNGLYVAVGANGTLLTSTDAVTWTAPGWLTSADLRAVGYGTPNAIAQFVALGAGGTVFTSSNGATWTAQTPIATSNTVAAVSFGSQYVAVGSKGSDFTSLDGINWQTQSSGTTNNLNAIARTALGFIAVGDAGTNIRTY